MDPSFNRIQQANTQITETFDATLGEAFYCFLIDLRDQTPKKDRHKTLRKMLKAITAIIALSAKIPYIPISLKSGPVLGPISAVGNTSSFFILEFWAASSLIDDFFSPKLPSEINFVQEKKPKKRALCRKVITISVASLIGLSSQLPTALAGAKYNEEPYKMVAGLVLLITGAILPIRSIQLSIKEIRRRMGQKMEAEVKEVKENMLQLLKTAHEGFIQKDLLDKALFIEHVKETREILSVAPYLLSFLAKKLPPPQKKTCFQKGVHFTGTVVGCSLAAIFELALAQYTYSLSKEEIFDNDVTAVSFATLTTGSTLYLFATSIVQTTQRIFNSFGNLITGKKERRLGSQLKPKLSFALSSLGLLLNLFGLFPTYIIWGDFYNKTASEKLFFEITMCSAIFFILFTSTLSIIDDLVTSSIKQGKRYEPEILQIHREFQKLEEFMQKHPRQFIGCLVNFLHAADQKDLLKRLKMTKDQLNTYVMDSSI